MGKTLGYMITWTTYGTWLQGDKRGYVKYGKVLGENKSLREANIAYQRSRAVKLKRDEREIVRKAIENEAGMLGQEIYAPSVCSNHVHVVVDNIDEPIDRTAGRYKRAGTMALRRNGFEGRVWTKGYDKRFCFDKKALREKVKYVKRHG